MTQPASLALEVWLFHKVHGPARMSRADATAAVRQHPGEWSYAPWSGDEIPAGGDVEIVHDWFHLGEQQRRGIAMRLDRTFANKSQAECDAVVAQHAGDRFAAASEPR